jgi:hypothetical protein
MSKDMLRTELNILHCGNWKLGAMYGGRDAFGAAAVLRKFSNRRPAIHDPWAGRSPSGRPIVCFDPLTWWDTINPSSLAGPPAVHQAAVRTVRLGHCVRKLPESILVDIDAGGKISTGGRAIQH